MPPKKAKNVFDPAAYEFPSELYERYLTDLYDEEPDMYAAEADEFGESPDVDVEGLLRARRTSAESGETIDKLENAMLVFLRKNDTDLYKEMLQAHDVSSAVGGSARRTVEGNNAEVISNMKSGRKSLQARLESQETKSTPMTTTPSPLAQPAGDIKTPTQPPTPTLPPIGLTSMPSPTQTPLSNAMVDVVQPPPTQPASTSGPSPPGADAPSTTELRLSFPADGIVFTKPGASAVQAIRTQTAVEFVQWNETIPNGGTISIHAQVVTELGHQYLFCMPVLQAKSGVFGTFFTKAANAKEMLTLTNMLETLHLTDPRPRPTDYAWPVLDGISVSPDVLTGQLRAVRRTTIRPAVPPPTSTFGKLKSLVWSTASTATTTTETVDSFAVGRWINRDTANQFQRLNSSSLAIEKTWLLTNRFAWIPSGYERQWDRLPFYLPRSTSDDILALFIKTPDATMCDKCVNVWPRASFWSNFFDAFSLLLLRKIACTLGTDGETARVHEDMLVSVASIAREYLSGNAANLAVIQLLSCMRLIHGFGTEAAPRLHIDNACAIDGTSDVSTLWSTTPFLGDANRNLVAEEESKLSLTQSLDWHSKNLDVLSKNGSIRRIEMLAHVASLDVVGGFIMGLRTSKSLDFLHTSLPQPTTTMDPRLLVIASPYVWQSDTCFTIARVAAKTTPFGYEVKRGEKNIQTYDALASNRCSSFATQLKRDETLRNPVIDKPAMWMLDGGIVSLVDQTNTAHPWALTTILSRYEDMLFKDPSNQPFLQMHVRAAIEMIMADLSRHLGRVLQQFRDVVIADISKWEAQSMTRVQASRKMSDLARTDVVGNRNEILTLFRRVSLTDPTVRDARWNAVRARVATHPVVSLKETVVRLIESGIKLTTKVYKKPIRSLQLTTLLNKLESGTRPPTLVPSVGSGAGGDDARETISPTIPSLEQLYAWMNTNLDESDSSDARMWQTIFYESLRPVPYMHEYGWTLTQDDLSNDGFVGWLVKTSADELARRPVHPHQAMIRKLQYDLFVKNGDGSLPTMWSDLRVHTEITAYLHPTLGCAYSQSAGDGNEQSAALSVNGSVLWYVPYHIGALVRPATDSSSALSPVYCASIPEIQSVHVGDVEGWNVESETAIGKWVDQFVAYLRSIVGLIDTDPAVRHIVDYVESVMMPDAVSTQQFVYEFRMHSSRTGMADEYVFDPSFIDLCGLYKWVLSQWDLTVAVDIQKRFTPRGGPQSYHALFLLIASMRIIVLAAIHRARDPVAFKTFAYPSVDDWTAAKQMAATTG